MAFLRGELDAAQAQLEAAAAGEAGGDGATAAEVQYRLGRLLWARGGDAREQRDGALTHLLQAAAAPGRCQVRFLISRRASISSPFSRVTFEDGSPARASRLAEVLLQLPPWASPPR